MRPPSLITQKVQEFHARLTPEQREEQAARKLARKMQRDRDRDRER
jgi:hypothetical protein